MVVQLPSGPFTVDAYHRLGELGILGEDDRVELIHGQIVPMNPIGVPHASCVKRLVRLLSPLSARQAATLGVQDPLMLAEHEEPLPDVTLLRYRADGYAAAHPGPADTLLVIEVADASLAHDRNEKLPVYAESGISEVWLVNLPADVVEVYREPKDNHYTEVHTARRGDTVSPAAVPDLALEVDEILG